jgi:hypothetical protein
MYTMSSISEDTIKLLHKIRKMRHTATYDSVDMVSGAEADAAMKVAVELGKHVMAWLKSEHPELMK